MREAYMYASMHLYFLKCVILSVLNEADKIIKSTNRF